jgi:hypothetical protein
MILSFVTKNILHLQCQHLQLHRLSRREEDDFEVSYFEDPVRIFFETVIQDPKSSFSVASYNEITGIFKTSH